MLVRVRAFAMTKSQIQIGARIDRLRQSGRVFVVMLAAAIASSPGCTGQRSRSGGSNPSGKPELQRGFNAAALRSDLYDFADEFTAQVAGVASEIAGASPDRTVREATLIFKSRLIPHFQSLIVDDDPREALINAWTTCVQVRIYLTEGRGQAIFGAAQATAVSMIQDLEARILSIALSHAPEPMVTEAGKAIEVYAR